MAKVLAWDRAGSVVPLAITAPESAALLADVDPDLRAASWHFRDPGGTVFSAGEAFAPLLRLLPGGAPFAELALRFPRVVERAYRLVASNRGALSALVTRRARVRIDRRLAQTRPPGG